MARSKDDIAKAAANGCRKSKIELAYLIRYTAKDVNAEGKKRQT
jgi:hypothetical protein